MNQHNTSATTNAAYTVMLPCEPNQFNEFISGLLGKPQTISQQLAGAFELKKQDILNLYHLVIQRVGQQNRGTLIQFTTTIVFDDGSSVLLNSLADLEAYHEVRPVVSTQAHLSWSFLLFFEPHQAPEKQEIDVSFVSRTRWSSDSGFPIVLNRVSGIVSFRIEHTARTWGADIQALLKNHLETMVSQESTLKVFIRRHSGKISLLVIGAILMSTFFGIYQASASLSALRLDLLNELKGAEVSLSQKIDGAIFFLSSNSMNNFLLASIGYIIGAIILSIIIGIWIETSTDSSKPSFVLLSPTSDKHRIKTLEKYKNKWSSFLFSIVISIATGIIGNIIYTNYWSN